MAINPLDDLLGNHDPDSAAPALGYGGIDRSQTTPATFPLPAGTRTIKVYNHPDPKHPGKLLPVRRRVSKQAERGGLGVSARQAKRQRMADLKELTRERKGK